MQSPQPANIVLFFAVKGNGSLERIKSKKRQLFNGLVLWRMVRSRDLLAVTAIQLSPMGKRIHASMNYHFHCMKFERHHGGKL